MTTDDAAVARFVLARGWVTEPRIKDALFDQVAGPSARDGRRRPRTLLSILVARGWLTPAQAHEVEGACRGASVSHASDDSQASQFAPPDDTLLASEDPRNLYGHLVRVARVGHGGMGTVWRAWDTNLRRWVAMKFVAASQRHLLKEARLGAKLTHPNIVPIYDVVGEESGEPYLVMKFIEGGTLYDFIGEITPDRAAELLMQVAHAVQYAHERSVIHRDLKPKNILIEADGRPVVSDFGLARDLVTSGTGVGLVVGTPAYIAPEQVTEGAPPAGPAADVYGLGATLYHVLTGRPPYEGDAPDRILEQIRDVAPPAPRGVNPDIPPNLERIVLRAMERNVQKRYTSAAEMAMDLDRFLRREPILGLGEEAFAEAISLLEVGHLRKGILRLREALRLPWAPGSSEESWRPMMRQLKESESSLSLALQIRPAYVVALRHRACLRLARALLLGLIVGRPSADDLAGASEDIERALAASPAGHHLGMTRAALWLVRARFSKCLGVRADEEIRKALSELDRIIHRSPTVVALHNRALANILLGQRRHRAGADAREQYRQAIADLEQAIDLDPNDELLLEDLARSYHGRSKRRLTDKEEDRKSLRQYLERAIQRHPSHAATRLRHRLAELAEAMPLLEDRDL